MQAAFLNGSRQLRERRGWPPAGPGPLPTMIMSACAAAPCARYPPGGIWHDRPAFPTAGRRRWRRPRVALGDADGLAHDRTGIVARSALVSVTAAQPSAFYLCPATLNALREHCSMACESDHPCRGGADSGGRESVLRKPLNMLLVLGSAAAVAMVGGPLAAQAAADGSVNVTSASPALPFSQNKQNEPAVAVDANHNSIMVAGSNDEIDEQACSSQFPASPCPFTPGVGVSGVYFSFDSGKSWTQPMYTGYTARGCTADFTTPVSACAQTEGRIGTPPWYEESGLVSDGDPGVAFGPAPGPNGFSWSNGDRVLLLQPHVELPGGQQLQRIRSHRRLAHGQPHPGQHPQQGFMDEAGGDLQAVEHHLFRQVAGLGRQRRLQSVLRRRVRLLGDVPGPGEGPRRPGRTPGGRLPRRRRRPGRSTRSRPPPTTASATPPTAAPSAPTAWATPMFSASEPCNRPAEQSFELMSVSRNGGGTWSAQTPVAGPVHRPGILDPAQGRPTIDGIAGLAATWPQPPASTSPTAPRPATARPTTW